MEKKPKTEEEIEQSGLDRDCQKVVSKFYIQLPFYTFRYGNSYLARKVVETTEGFRVPNQAEKHAAYR